MWRSRAARSRFQFRGKSGVEHQVSVKDRRLATDGQALPWRLPGQNLFQYLDEDGAARTPSARRTSTRTCKALPAPTSPPRTTAPGPAARWRWRYCASCSGSRNPKPSAMWWRRSRTSPNSWATPRRCAASAISTRRGRRLFARRVGAITPNRERARACAPKKSRWRCCWSNWLLNRRIDLPIFCTITNDFYS